MSDFSLPELRPLSMGQLIDRAFRLYRKHFLTFVGIIAITQIPVLLLNIIAIMAAPDNPELSDLDPLLGENPFFLLLEQQQSVNGAIALLASIISIVVALVAQVAITRAIGNAYLGRPISLTDAFSQVGKSFVNLLVAFIFIIGLVILLFLWTLIPCIGWITGPGMFFFLATVIVPLLAPIIVLEKQGASNAIYRSWDLARRRFWWVFGLVLLLSLLAQLIIVGPTALALLLFTSAIGGGTDPQLAGIAQQIVNLALTTIYQPLQYACIVLLYLDIRVRTEGFDLALLAAATDEAADAQTSMEVLSDVPAPPKSIRPTGEELVNFAGITLGYLALVAILVGLLFLVTIAITNFI